ncbi:MULTISPECIES: TauD/TfdA family dioxygenase [Alteromonas]|jgi:alpha-ketoglutarate-dependent taurine dioxygenase|uniref:TauD/TfdA-like domain-containing protein n=2 Tax=Alteromonas mediterranea TaxID=314275 RepID=A0AAC8XNM6_9ALTE|nr:TauD/TfdA family dioxygenase [Alteromonas mediterranea]AGP88179.1 taurine catabolism dioxygenase TauD/TfdA [Alteromonas mediterranea U7]AGP92056.1 taurine catabolism dioxygenase TauD/TfdA [Alteromonas mediterranea U8]AFV87759.1 taurine catabolism dioxygenase TauD/TfdA [Alteromonas mediterranea DE1]AGP87799.1 taurine catabolism dioxygenase TauD/TfdA [Alteromonas mediterranea U4]AGP99781.1 taurine catabolism dioxygenase TauD/TfdA [Alteromonas mediterranea UM7]|tara:strand:- start:23765 stop:24754 length:990 start_codon:yes stop_codon:yes gene_type:complete
MLNEEWFKQCFNHVLPTENSAPLIIQPRVRGVDVAFFLNKYRDQFNATLCEFGAIVLRASGVDEAVDFKKISDSISPHSMPYEEKSTPRASINDVQHVYTSTEYPSRLKIDLHCENSYAHVWPNKVMFWCKRPAEQGGETLLADTRKVLAMLPDWLVTECQHSNVYYRRTFSTEIGYGWQAAFDVNTVSELEAKLILKGYQWEWKGGNLHTLRSGNWIANHPRTQEQVWFNHAHFFHPMSVSSSLGQDPDAARNIAATLPYRVTFESQAIDDNAVAQIRSAFQACSYRLPLKKGDVLMIDNMLMAHGRNAFEGERQVFVTMTEPNTNSR